jgi:hypothetical protein
MWQNVMGIHLQTLECEFLMSTGAEMPLNKTVAENFIGVECDGVADMVIHTLLLHHVIC